MKPEEIDHEKDKSTHTAQNFVAFERKGHMCLQECQEAQVYH